MGVIAALDELEYRHARLDLVVPSGATTGTVQVTTPSGTISSNVAFRVT